MRQVRQFSGQYAAATMIVIAVLQACAGQNLPPIDTGMRADQYESIAIRAIPYKPNVARIRSPVEGAGEGASAGAEAGTIGWLGACGIGSGGILLLACLVVTPVATVTGAIAGAAASHSPEEVTSATTALKNVFEEATPAVGLTRAVARSLQETRSKMRQSRILSSSETSLTDPELLRLGFDAVLEVEIIQFDLAVYGQFDPEAAVNIVVRADLRETAGRSTSIPLSWTYEGNRQSYFELAKDNARLLRKTFNRSYDETAALIVGDLFFTSTPN